MVPLMDALRRMTLDPARRLERRTPAMANKGRVKVGADADLTIFDPATVIDRSTYEDATIPSAGIPYVIVGGQTVVDGGDVTAARPGRAIRAPIAAATALVTLDSTRTARSPGSSPEITSVSRDFRTAGRSDSSPNRTGRPHR